MTQQLVQQAAQQLAPWVPVFTFVLGQIFAIVLEWMRGKATAGRERVARAQGRQEAIDDRRAQFQRETLKELQDTLLQLHRTNAQLKLADERAFKQTELWGRGRLDPATNEQARLLQARVSLLNARVLDDDIRQLVEDIQDASFNLMSAPTQAAAVQADTALMAAARRVNARIGEVLRALY